MQSNFLRLNIQDLLKGAVVAVIVVILGAIEQALKTHGFDFGAYDWSGIANLAVTAFVGYLGKNFLTDSSGKIAGVI